MDYQVGEGSAADLSCGALEATAAQGTAAEGTTRAPHPLASPQEERGTGEIIIVTSEVH